MTFKEKLKSYNFWISLVSALILILNILGDKFNFTVDPNLVIDLSTALCSIFVILGIISIPKQKTNTNYTIEQTTERISADIKDSLSNLINKSSLSVSIKEALSSFVEFKENINDMFNKELNEKPIEKIDSNNTSIDKTENNLNEVKKDDVVINQEVAMGFNNPEIINSINTQSSVSIETYDNKVE